MPFTGHAEAIIDAKQRLALPAKFRARWNPAVDGPTWMAVPWFPGATLRLYPQQTFDELYRAGRQSPSLFPAEDEIALDQAVLALTETLELDANHRVRLPAWQIEKLNLPREVIVLGVGDRLEIHPREGWNARFDKMIEQMGSLAAQRRARTDG